MTRADRIAADARSTVSSWASLNSRVASVFPLEDGSAEVTLAGVDRRFEDVFAAIREVESLGMVAEVARFPDPSADRPRVLAESPGLRVI